MTLDQLETFIAIAKEGGLRAASKVLHKTQPTLSAGIKNLEEELGVTLLDRDSYRVKLTEQGEALFIKAQEIIAQVDQFKVIAHELTMGREPKLKLAIDYMSPMNFLLSVLSRFTKSCGKTKIELDFEVLTGAEEKVLANDANMAITPFISKHSQSEFQKICDIEILPVISKSILKVSNPDLKTFLTLPQIVVKDSSKNPGQINFGGHRDSQQWVVSDHMIKKELIANGFGWGHLERSSIEKELKSGKLIELKVPGIQAKKMPLYIIRSNSRVFGPAAQELWSHLLENFSEIK